MAEKKPYKMKNVAIRMVNAPPVYSHEEIRTPRDVANLLTEELKGYDREVLCVVNFKTNMQPICMNIASMGTIDASLVSPREIFKSAILSNAAHIMLIHNHPSGRALPSRMDDVITEQVKNAADIMGIPLLDHVITGDGCYYSYREQGRIIGEPDRTPMVAEPKESLSAALERCMEKAAEYNASRHGKEAVRKLPDKNRGL